jgi:hypothetical protein
MSEGRCRRRWCRVAVALIAGVFRLASFQVEAVEPIQDRSRGPQDYQSSNFILHTDLESQEADDLLKRLEKMLSLVSKYWGRRNNKKIECYVVKDLSNWPDGSLHPAGRQKIAQRAGVTLTRTVSRGNQFNAKSIVFSTADRGTAQHEAVHAYCGQMFGRTGPIWYAEGMAEMGQYWREGDRTVNCDPYVIDYLKNTHPMSLNEIVNGRSESGDSWQNYAWRWALCHLLANNPNYSERFRPLGLGLLTGKNVSFEQVYGSMAREISFEYLFFLEHMETGYRVDLCGWDWKGKYRVPRVGKGRAVMVKADAGWQSTRLLVSNDTQYTWSASGEWQVEDDGSMLTADGDSNGTGKLVAIVLKDEYELSEPIELGVEGTFTPPTDGKLFLRCRDRWGSLADNSGSVSVMIVPAED